jgi:hypothetical protein
MRATAAEGRPPATDREVLDAMTRSLAYIWPMRTSTA